MPRSLAAIFQENPGVIVLEFVSYKDHEPFGISAEGKKLTIFEDEGFARALSELPGANTNKGHVSAEGFCICKGEYNIKKDGYKVHVWRSAQHLTGEI